jgi:hypothetical protein
VHPSAIATASAVKAETEGAKRKVGKSNLRAAISDVSFSPRHRGVTGEPPHRKVARRRKQEVYNSSSGDEEAVAAHSPCQYHDLGMIMTGRFLDRSGDSFRVDIDIGEATAPDLDSNDNEGWGTQKMATAEEHDDYCRMLGIPTHLSSPEDSDSDEKGHLNYLCAMYGDCVNDGWRTPEDSDEKGSLDALCAQYEEICLGGSDSPVVTPCDSEESSNSSEDRCSEDYSSDEHCGRYPTDESASDGEDH